MFKLLEECEINTRRVKLIIIDQFIFLLKFVQMHGHHDFYRDFRNQNGQRNILWPKNLYPMRIITLSKAYEDITLGPQYRLRNCKTSARLFLSIDIDDSYLAHMLLCQFFDCCLELIEKLNIVIIPIERTTKTGRLEETLHSWN